MRQWKYAETKIMAILKEAHPEYVNKVWWHGDQFRYLLEARDPRLLGARPQM